jgi:hypothetical protein
MFVSFWWKCASASAMSAWPGGKFWRIWSGEPAIHTGDCNIYWSIGGEGDSLLGYFPEYADNHKALTGTPAGSVPSIVQVPSTDTWATNQWYRVDLVYAFALGIVELYKDLQLHIRVSADGNHYPQVAAAAYQIVWPEWIAAPGSGNGLVSLLSEPKAGFLTHIDDVYISGTRARVELGDANTWAGCTRREIQPVSAWADGEISIAACNVGAFAPDDSAWLYVVTDAGAVSAGAPVTVA